METAWSEVSNGELPVAVVRVDAEINELIFGYCETEASTSSFLRRFSQPLKCFFIADIVLQAQKHAVRNNWQLENNKTSDAILIVTSLLQIIS